MIPSMTRIVLNTFREKRGEREKREEHKKIIGRNEMELALCNKFRTFIRGLE